MGKKNIYTLLIIFIITGILYLCFIQYINNEKNSKDPIKAVPTNAAIILKMQEWTETWRDLETSKLWTQLTKNKKWIDVKKTIAEINSKIIEEKKLKELFKHQIMYVSIHDSTDDFDILITTTISDSNILKLFKTHFLNTDFSTRYYDNIKIYQLKNNISFSIYEGIIFFGSSYFVVENSIRQLNNKVSLLNNSSFMQVRETESTFSNSHVYINYNRLAKLLKGVYEMSFTETKNLSRWAEWAELDLKIKENTFLFSGFTLAQDSSQNYLNTLSEQTPQIIVMDNILPSNTQKIGILGINDFGAYYVKYQEFLAKHNNLYEQTKWIKEKNKQYDFNLENTFKTIIGNELGYINTYSKSGNGEDYILIKSPAESVQILNHLNKNIKEPFFESSYRNYKLNKLHLPNVLGKILGPLFNSIEENYFCWIDGYLVFSNSEKGLKTFINHFLSQRTLKNNIYYQDYKENLSLKCNYLFYMNPGLKNWSQIKESLTPWIKIQDWNNINAFAYQLTNHNELFYNNVVVNHEPNLRDKNKLLWSVSLDNTFYSKPNFITNHYSGLKEILIQDESGFLHLINTQGKTLWKKNIGGKIISEIHQIDFYKNKKLQILFNSTDSLYLLDRNGNYLEGYPIKLIKSATTGLTLIDYDNNRKYRILIPSIDNMIYNYDKTGNIVKGWKFQKMTGQINQKPEYYLHNNKDYIYSIDTEGNAKIIGRNGKTRINLGKIPIKHNYYINHENGEIYTNDNKGNIWRTDLNGTQTIIKSNITTEEYYFLAEDINGDKKIEIIIADQELNGYKSEKKFFNHQIKSEEIPQVFSFQNQKYIGLKESEKIYLLDSNGNINQGPLYGEGLFNCEDIDNDGKLNLIIGSGDLIYNYSLE